MNENLIQILIVIPLYNHQKTIAAVVKRCLALQPDILVVDDGSTDLPDNFSQSIGVPLIRHSRNLGKGAALMTAARYAAERGYTHMVSLDADLQHSPEDFLKFKVAISRNPDTLFIGKRNFSDPSVPNLSRFGRQFSNFWFRIQTGQSAGDAQSGFRAYPLYVLEHLSLSQTRYDFEIEVLVKAAWADVPIKSLDIGVTYQTGGARVSHFSLLMDNLRLTRLNTRLTIRSFLPWPHKKIIEPKQEIKFSILHPIDSIRNFVSHKLTPFEIALSAMVGIFLGTLPLIALHSLAILMVTGFFRLNKFVALGISQFCMPPIVPALCIETGYFMTHGGQFLTEISFETLGYQALDRFYEWCIGSLLVAPVLGLIVFIIVYLAAASMSSALERE
ncbi:MAG: DUF2062 domain-containing protein [Desulfobacteraceae bacterium]|nr:DUF2062 domain-containing protein [Desulfobacteraceae bacterium]